MVYRRSVVGLSDQIEHPGDNRDTDDSECCDVDGGVDDTFPVLHRKNVAKFEEIRNLVGPEADYCLGMGIEIPR